MDAILEASRVFGNFSRFKDVRDILSSHKGMLQHLELIELSSINKVSLVYVSFCSNTGSIRDDPYWTSRKNSLELIELSSINKVSLVYVSFCSNTGSIRDDPN
jgi:hypothetical protein